MDSLVSKTGLVLVALLAAVWSADGSSAVPAGGAAKPGAQDLSVLGRRVLRSGRAPWLQAEGEHFVCHAQSAADLAGLVEDAEYAYRKAGQFLGIAAGERKGHVFVVRPEGWSKMFRAVDRRRDILSMQFHDEIFIGQSDGESSRLVRLCHEMVHLRLWQRYGDRVPVWLDEGLASNLGWKIAEDRRRGQGFQLTRAFPPLPRDAFASLSALTSVSAYPGEAESPAFYRQTDALIGAIARRTGYDKLAEFVDGVAGQGRSWREVLRDRFAFAGFDFDWLEKEVTDRVSGKADK